MSSIVKKNNFSLSGKYDRFMAFFLPQRLKFRHFNGN